MFVPGAGARGFSLATARNCEGQGNRKQRHGGIEMKILVADDVEAMRCAVVACLVAAGHEVVEVSTGNEALARLSNEDFDAAVLDLWMPAGDGLSVLKRVRSVRPELRIVVMTGGGPRMPVEAAALIAEVWGAERVFLKPFRDQDLVDHLARAPLPAPPDAAMAHGAR